MEFGRQAPDVGTWDLMSARFSLPHVFVARFGKIDKLFRLG
jgi:hypothetical protein